MQIFGTHTYMQIYIESFLSKKCFRNISVGIKWTSHKEKLCAHDCETRYMVLMHIKT